MGMPSSQPPNSEPAAASTTTTTTTATVAAPTATVAVTSPHPINPIMAATTNNDINITAASLRGSPSDRIIKPRPRKDSLQSISGSDSVPGRVQKPRAKKSPGSGAKRSEPSKRKFICSFSHYGCDVALSSKNEWKRHVSIQHLQLGFYRCDVGSCNPDNNPNTPQHKKVFNDFNRKDLFTQHHRRMHKPESGPGSSVMILGGENSKDWRAFEDSLESVRNRCWQEKRKPPQRSTCGFCGRVFEGEGSWNDRMEHVGGHFSRDLPEVCKEEREDEDLTNWAIQEGIIKESPAGRHILIDQPASSTERPYTARDRDVAMSDAPPVTPTTATNGQDGQYPLDMDQGRRQSSGSSVYPPLNGSGRPGSSSGQLLAPAPPRGGVPTSPGRSAGGRQYSVQPPPMSRGSFSGEGDSGDRLEDLINTLINPKKPSMTRRLTWKCDCGLDSSVDFNEESADDERALHNLGKISIICKNTQSPYLKTSKTESYEIIPCNDLASYIQREGKESMERGLETVNEAIDGDGSVMDDAPIAVTSSEQ